MPGLSGTGNVIRQEGTGRGVGRGKEATVARVKTRDWVRMAIGAALVLALVGAEGATLWGQSRPSRAHGQLTEGIECYRRGDYELAASWFAQALAGQDFLKDTERQELANQIELNTAALKARGEGAEQLRKAQDAAKAGRTAEALNLLRNLSANQFLSPADSQEVQKLMDQLRPARRRRFAADRASRFADGACPRQASASSGADGQGRLGHRVRSGR